MGVHRYALASIGWFCAASAFAQDVTGATGDTERAVRRALQQLPERPAHVAVIERTRARQLHPALTSGAEAFVPDGSTTIYLVRQGDTLQHAAAQGGIFEYALAIIIWHEMAHVAGAGELEAQDREEALWQQFVADGRVDRTRGTKYLALLKQRRSQATR
jgi:hypothetical protein